VDFLEEDAGAFLLFAEGVDGLGDVTFDDVVAEDDGDLAAVGEVFGETESVGDAAFAFLVGEVELAEADGLSVAEEFDECPGVFSAGDDEDIGDAGVTEAFDGVHDHGFVVDGEEMFVGDFGEGAEASAEAAGEDDAFHGRFLGSGERCTGGAPYRPVEGF